jgi:predicted nucleic acid-binding protein
MIVADASVLMEVLLRTAVGTEVEKQLFAPGQTINIPYLTDLEVLQVLRRYLRKRVLSAVRARQAIDDYADMPLNRYPHGVLLARIWGLRDNFTAYDAAYIALAEALDSPLMTCDRAFAAGGHRAKVQIVNGFRIIGR